MDAVLICILLLGGHDFNNYELGERMTHCVDLVERADDAGVDPHLTASLAYYESHFNHRAVSKAGARGVLQVIPYHHCPRKGECDYVEVGLKALKRLLRKKRDPLMAVCHYNGGTRCGKRSKRWAKHVVRTAKRLRRVDISAN